MSSDTIFLKTAPYIDKVLRLIRAEIRRHEGILIEEEDLARATHGTLSEHVRKENGLLYLPFHGSPRLLTKSFS
jgi:hypothetical protein